MAENKVFHGEFGPRLGTDGNLHEEESDDLDHAIQTSDRSWKSQKFCGSRGFRKSHPAHHPDLGAAPAGLVVAGPLC